MVDRVIGIMKAYITRVGAGPFPTELLDDRPASDWASAARSSAPSPGGSGAAAGSTPCVLRYAARSTASPS